MQQQTNRASLRPFLLLWSTQSLSQLGSAMTSFALIIWAYGQTGSALSTALLTVCSYAPYVCLSVFAGALCDRWDKKTVMLASDSFAALCTAAVLVLSLGGGLQVWHLYAINVLTGLMNTVQQPASDVAVSLLVPPQYYQKAGGLRYFSNSLTGILTPVLAAALLGFGGLQVVLMADLASFFVAFATLLWGIHLPGAPVKQVGGAGVLAEAAAGLRYLKQQRGILHLILFLALINFTASVYNAALTPMLLSRQGGGQQVLGLVNAVTGAATLVGSLLASTLPAPKNRVRVVLNTLLFSMGTENFILALGRSAPAWCVGAALGWVGIPLMGANLDVLLRGNVPLALQGRVFAARNTLQFFTIPLGNLAGGLLVDRVFEPLLARQSAASPLVALVGAGKGSGAALLFLVLGAVGLLTCVLFRFDKPLRALGQQDGRG
jgi:hypothetical protein